MSKGPQLFCDATGYKLVLNSIQIQIINLLLVDVEHSQIYLRVCTLSIVLSVDNLMRRNVGYYSDLARACGLDLGSNSIDGKNLGEARSIACIRAIHSEEARFFRFCQLNLVTTVRCFINRTTLG